MPVFSLFDTVTLSFEVGALKPEPEIYLDALRKLSLPPEACVFIDDIGKYAEGAAEVGIRGIRYTGHAELVRELSSLGVTPAVKTGQTDQERGESSFSGAGRVARSTIAGGSMSPRSEVTPRSRSRRAPGRTRDSYDPTALL